MNKQRREGDGKAPALPPINSDAFKCVPNQGFGKGVPTKPKV